MVAVVGDETTVIGKKRLGRLLDGDDVRDSNEFVFDGSRSWSKERFIAMHEAIDNETRRNK